MTKTGMDGMYQTISEIYRSNICFPCDCFIMSVPLLNQIIYLRLEATIVTTMEVVVEELCRRTVAKIPIIRFEIGLLRMSLLENAFPAALPTTIL